MIRVALSVAVAVLAAPAWTEQQSGVTARFRGITAFSDRVAWASGSGGTVVRTADGGATWQRLTIPNAEKLDFRDIDAVSDDTAFALSIGSGDSSRIYKTIDAGKTWTLQYTNTDPKAFFDAMAFWDAERGLAFSDSVDGQLVMVRTENGGRTWTRVPAAGLPWFMALFGRDAIITSLQAIPFVPQLAATTLNVLAARDPAMAAISWSIARVRERIAPASAAAGRLAAGGTGEGADVAARLVPAPPATALAIRLSNCVSAPPPLACDNLWRRRAGKCSLKPAIAAKRSLSRPYLSSTLLP